MIDELLMRMISPEVWKTDPFELYAQIREEGPVLRTSFGPYIVSGYSEVATVLRDRRLGRGMEIGDDPFRSAWLAEYYRDKLNNFIATDQDTPLRPLARNAFRRQVVEDLRPAFQGRVEQVVGEFVDQGGGEFMSSIAAPLTIGLVGDVLGIPASDRADLAHHVYWISLGLDPLLSESEASNALASFKWFHEYFTDLVNERVRNPKDDLVTRIATSGEDPDAIVSTLVILVTTITPPINFLGNAVLALTDNPDQLADWRQHPEITPSAVTELIRHQPPVPFNMRRALEPVELCGMSLECGDAVILMTAGANRDPARFTDPEKLDLRRNEGEPLSFGGGLHHCMGVAMSHMQGEITLGTLVTLTSSIEVKSFEWRPGVLARGPSELWLTLSDPTEGE